MTCQFPMEKPAPRVKSVRRVVEELFALRESLHNKQSPTGHQLEDAKLGMQLESDEWVRSTRSEEKYARYAVLVRLWEKLSIPERWAMSLLYLPNGEVEYQRVVHKSELIPLYVPLADGEGGECGALKRDGTRCRNPRKPGEARCHIPSHYEQQAPVLTYVTPPPRSEELVCSAAPLAPRADDPSPYGRVAAASGTRWSFDAKDAPARPQEAIADFLEHRRRVDSPVDEGEYEDLCIVRGRRATYMRHGEAATEMNRWAQERVWQLQYLGYRVAPPPVFTARSVRALIQSARDKFIDSEWFRLASEER